MKHPVNIPIASIVLNIVLIILNCFKMFLFTIYLNCDSNKTHTLQLVDMSLKFLNI